jgi:hypothetical protein
MPLPLIPVIAALTAGGTLVPHAAGGLIVTSVGGYVTGTYLSTAAVTSLVLGGLGALGTGAAAVTGAAASVVGGAGVFGTTIGATGITGVLMSAGIISATPLWVPVAIGGAATGAAAGAGFGAYRYYRLRKKLRVTVEGQEAQFTEAEAKLVERFLRWFAKRQPPSSEA